jgi:hypothetical protein
LVKIKEREGEKQNESKMEVNRKNGSEREQGRSGRAIRTKGGRIPVGVVL